MQGGPARMQPECSLVQRMGDPDPYELTLISSRSLTKDGCPITPGFSGRVLWYPTQAKIRLEWGTHLWLLVHRKFEVVTRRQLSHPLPVPAAKSGCPMAPISCGGLWR
jgi:hypothetical protein